MLEVLAAVARRACKRIHSRRSAHEPLRSLEDDREDPPALDDAALEGEFDHCLQKVVVGAMQTMTVEQAQAFLGERRASRRAR